MRGRTVQLFLGGGKTLLTHGDLLPRNILVEGSKITGILDWETAGYYPEFWGYCEMHGPGWMTPARACVLGRIFPGPRREKEIKAVGNPRPREPASSLYALQRSTAKALITHKYPFQSMP